MHIIGISAPLCCLFWHFVLTIITLVDYIVYVREEKEIGQDLKDAHFAFSVIGMVAYGTTAAPLFVHGYKYGKSQTVRTNRLMSGMAVMFSFSSMPMVIIELIIFLELDYMFGHPLDGMVFILHILGCIIGGAVSWMAYLRAAAVFIQRMRGPERQINDNIEKNEFGSTRLVLPDPLPGQPDVI